MVLRLVGVVVVGLVAPDLNLSEAEAVVVDLNPSEVKQLLQAGTARAAPGIIRTSGRPRPRG